MTDVFQLKIMFYRTLQSGDTISTFILADTKVEIQLTVNVLMDKFFDYFAFAGLCMNPKKSELILFRNGRKTF